MPEPFKTCGSQSIGLYPIVDSAAWVTRLLALGVSTIQLRIKEGRPEAIAAEIQAAVLAAERTSARLFINDHWEMALAYKAYGLHLGQEDLQTADITAIQKAGLRLGLSTHSLEELEIALSLQPSYVALGPIFPTTSKIMTWEQQGLEKLELWRAMTGDTSLVAIGGINRSQIDTVLATGVDGVAIISAITQADNPEAETRYLLDRVDAYQCKA